MMSGKLCVFAGGSFQESFGETSGPSQVNFFGIASPAEKAVLVNSNDIVPPSACARGLPGSHGKKQRTKQARTTTLLRTDIFLDSLLRGSVAAQKFGDFGMATLAREAES